MKYFKIKLYITLLSLSISFITKTNLMVAYLPIEYTNNIYESSIKTVLLTQSGSYERFPAIDLNSNQQLNLQFDELMPENDNYQYTFIHCSADWQLSP